MSDENNKRITFEEFIKTDQKHISGVDNELTALLKEILLAGKSISSISGRAPISGLTGTDGSVNQHGDKVKKLDLIAEEEMVSALRRATSVCMAVSEETEEVIHLNSENGNYIVSFDPIDGSANIDTNLSTGTIFSISKRQSKIGGKPDEEEVLQTGDVQVVAGYFLYGPALVFCFTAGSGVHQFILDSDTGTFILVRENCKIPGHGTVYSINEGGVETFSAGVKNYIRYCQEGDPATGRPYLSRYCGAMVADIHRILLEGGIFIYPRTDEFPSGKVRMLYECNPMSFIIEEAGGMSVNGRKRIMEVEPDDIHQQSPIFIGSTQNVKTVLSFLENQDQ